MTNHERITKALGERKGITLTSAQINALVARDGGKADAWPTDHSANGNGHTYCTHCRANGTLFTRNADGSYTYNGPVALSARRAAAKDAKAVAAEAIDLLAKYDASKGPSLDASKQSAAGKAASATTK